ncbi:cytochrome c-type biogenesis protein CcmH [Salipaludibacillus daqingensis]|uniref:cytochrome c-type biogenesis protein CcmH n=1 Tax=Salipaludibacillus daqingensis TaxID=3041001 RepID=UPI00247699AF|nr:cytochrome c-type biogenesis protein CcmH [Salipaludibacillus daqingensis]
MVKKLKMLPVLFALMFLVMPTFHGEEMHDTNSSEVKEIASKLSMEGHSEHELATCSTKNRYYEEIAEMLNEGYTDEEVLAEYEAMYGEQGLRAPKTTGFSIFAWTIPFLVLGVGSTVFFMRVKRHVIDEGTKEENGTNARTEESQDDPEDEVIRAIIEEEKRKHF